jgi:protein tyrosine phosphatase
MEEPNLVPVPRTWWIDPGKVLGGASPVAPDTEQTKLTILRLIQAGIKVVINLQEEGENTHNGDHLPEYCSILQEIASKNSTEIDVFRFPVPDGETPSIEQMVSIIDKINAALRENKMVFVHCLAGYGRTGTVAWSWLIDKGMSSSEAMVAIKKIRHSTDFLRLKNLLDIFNWKSWNGDSH